MQDYKSFFLYTMHIKIIFEHCLIKFKQKNSENISEFLNKHTIIESPMN